MVELAERLQAKHHGVVALISRCEETGLVARNISRGDMRLVEVQLTKRNEHCLEQLARLHRAEHLSLRDGFVLPALNASSPEQAWR